MTSRPWLEDRIVRVARLGSDHVADWPRRDPDVPYAITFGQWGNKNVGLVIDAWAALATRGEAMPLSILGLPATARGTFERQVADRGLGDLVTLLPWLTDEDFRTTFASAALVVFPSDFEGFGLPAVEAMRLGIPLVISPDAALLEVTGGHAAVMSDFATDALVRRRSRGSSDARRDDRARPHARRAADVGADRRRDARDAVRIDRSATRGLRGPMRAPRGGSRRRARSRPGTACRSEHRRTSVGLASRQRLSRLMRRR